MSDAGDERFRFRRTISLRFGDLDVLGHVNHRAYLDVLETTRVGYYLDVVGVRSPVEIRFVLAELRIRYLASALLGQTFEVWLRVAWLKRSSSGFEFSIRDQTTGRVLADGDGVQVWVDLEANRSEPLPEAYARRIRQFEGLQ